MLRLENVSKSWGTFALRDVSLHVPAGEFFVLLGPSGAGKTLLLETIAGFHRPDAGRILIGGEAVTRLPPERRNIGFVYQDHMLFPHRTVRRNVAYGLEARGVAKAKVAAKLSELSQLLCLNGLMDRRVAGLSGGESQRVALARALAVEPDLLLLDEPFASLDPPVRSGLWAELKRLHQDAGLTVLHVTHDRAEALALGQRIGVIKAGRIEQVGADLSVFQEPNSHFVAEFTGGRNIFAGSAHTGGTLTAFTSGALRLVTTATREGPCRAMVRPENIIISRGPIRTSARNQLRGRVEAVVRRGDIFEVTAAFGEHAMTCVVTPLSIEELAIGPGVEVYFSFKAGSVHLFDGDADMEHKQ